MAVLSFNRFGSAKRGVVYISTQMTVDLVLDLGRYMRPTAAQGKAFLTAGGKTAGGLPVVEYDLCGVTQYTKNHFIAHPRLSEGQWATADDSLVRAAGQLPTKMEAYILFYAAKRPELVQALASALPLLEEPPKAEAKA